MQNYLAKEVSAESYTSPDFIFLIYLVWWADGVYMCLQVGNDLGTFLLVGCRS